MSSKITETNQTNNTYNLSDDSEDEYKLIIDNCKQDINRYDILKDFSIKSERKKTTYGKYRLDKAIINTVKNYKFDDNDERNINFLICFSSSPLDS